MNKEILQIAIENLEIRMVYLHESHIKFHNDFDPLLPGQDLLGELNFRTTKHDIKVQETSEGNKTKYIRYFVNSGMRYFVGETSKELSEEEKLKSGNLACTVDAIYIAEYFIKNEEELTNEAMKEFGIFNAPHNVWPFWREYLFSILGKMSLPTTMIPMLRVGKSD